MPAIADWARSTIINGVSSAYSSLTKPNVDFTQNVTFLITDFSYHGLSNFAGGSLLQCIFITAIMMYMIDRRFLRALIWSLLASLLSFFGLIHATTVGILYRTTDDGWRFTVAYVMLAFVFLLFEIAQRRGWVQGPETEPDDLSSEEWAEWNKHKIAVQTDIDNTTF
jgi:AGZA family xanthine/uracil permease-like MFS transporter